MTLGRKLTAEALGTMVLLAAVVGPSIMGERLSDGNVAIALLANSIATGAALIATILALGTFREPRAGFSVRRLIQYPA